MKKDIILAGVGGQGILSIATTIGMAAIGSGLHLKQAEVHGMSQRGGDVHSDLRISSKEIASDLIPEGKADMVISVEPMESLRYLPMLAPDGWLVTSITPYVNIPNYPELQSVIDAIKAIPNHIALDAEQIASDMGHKRSANMVILGAASLFLGIEYQELEKAIANIFRSKGEEVISTNIKALKAGQEFATNYVKNHRPLV
jgi:indolepyruvate ferredoxin oxidoreductase, beta subunit